MMDDLISRQAAIDAIVDRCDMAKWSRDPKTEELVWTLEKLPSAQKRGEWVYCEDMYGVDGYRCDKCGFHAPWDYTHKFIDFIKDYHYCPKCGARMDGVE